MQLKFIHFALSILVSASLGLAAAVPTLSPNTTTTDASAKSAALTTIKSPLKLAAHAWTGEHYKGKEFEFTPETLGKCQSVDKFVPDHGGHPGGQHPHWHGHHPHNGGPWGDHPPHHPGGWPHPDDSSVESLKINKGYECTVFLNTECRKTYKFHWLKAHKNSWLGKLLKKLKVRKSWMKLKAGDYPDHQALKKFGPIEAVKCHRTHK